MANQIVAVAAVVITLLAGSSAVQLFHANVHGLTQCNGPDAKTELRNFIANRVEGNSFEVNGTLIIKEDIPGPINVSCIIERCASEDKPETCEYHTTYTMPNLCDEIKKKNRPWTKFVDNIGIEKECPLRKGEYHVQKYKLNLEILASLSVLRPFRVYWKMTSRLDSPQNPNFFCMKDMVSVEPKNKVKQGQRKSG